MSSGNSSFTGIQTSPGRFQYAQINDLRTTDIISGNIESNLLSSKNIPYIGTTVMGLLPESFFSQPFPSTTDIIYLVDENGNNISIPNTDQTIMVNSYIVNYSLQPGTGGAWTTPTVDVSTGNLTQGGFVAGQLNGGSTAFTSIPLTIVPPAVSTTFSICSGVGTGALAGQACTAPNGSNYLAVKFGGTITSGTGNPTGKFVTYYTYTTI